MLTQLAQLASVAISNAQLYEREHDRPDAPALAAPGRPARRPGLSAAVRFGPGGRERRARRRLLRPLRGRRRGLGRADRRRPGQGAGRRGRDRARPPHAARRAVYEQQPSGVLALLHRALREQAATALLHGRARTCGSARAASRSSSRAAGTRCRSWCIRTARVEPVGRLGTLLGTDIEPRLYDVTVELEVREVLLLYTDAVRGAPAGARSSGSRQLPSCCARAPRCRPTRSPVAWAAVIAASEGRLRDDMAILALGARLCFAGGDPSTEDIDG